MLVSFPKTYHATCTARPSVICKSPYVADVSIDDQSFIAHSPALGMDGYISYGKTVLVSKIDNPKGTCTYSILAAFDKKNSVYVGANPIYANKAFFTACKDGLLHDDFGEIDKIVPEYKHGDSRFDFFINDHIYVEVKSVLITENNVAKFPVGNKKKGTISERANKHIQELKCLTEDGNPCAIVFMILREDATDFIPNPKDQTFVDCLKDAHTAGVQVLVYQCKVDPHGISFVKKLNNTFF